MPAIRTLSVNENGVRTRDYSSKPKRVRTETSLENTGLCYSGPISCYHAWYGEEEEEEEEEQQQQQQQQEQQQQQHQQEESFDI
jgi:hypothetical protein